MKKTLVTALVVGGCMLTTEASSEQVAPDMTQKLVNASPGPRLFHRRALDDDEARPRNDDEDPPERE